MNPEILVFAQPPGTWPEFVRNAWIGLVLPTATVPDRFFFAYYVVTDVDNPMNMREKSPGYDVELKVAFAALEAVDPEAAKYAREHLCDPTQVYSLFFPAEVCHEVRSGEFELVQ